MRVANDCIWLCSNCAQIACNGPHGVELLDKDTTLNGLTKLGAHLVPNFDSETGDGIRAFSSRICGSCGSSLAGYRAKFAQLTDDLSITNDTNSELPRRDGESFLEWEQRYSTYHATREPDDERARR